MTHSIRIGERRISSDDPCYVIAEIGVNHNGEIQLAHKMIDAAKAAGADAVKFQTFRTDDLVMSNAPKAAYQKSKTGDGTQSDMLRRLELSTEEFHALQKHCTTLGIDFMSTAFDATSLETVVSMDPVCLKWPSGELNNIGLLKQAAKARLPILLSTGMGNLTEISAAVSVLNTHGCNDVVILQCVSNYPARIEDQNLRVIPAMAQMFSCPVGFSDHTIGPFAAIAARPMGMAVLEKHFTLDTEMEGPDHQASTMPADFNNMVKVLRAIEEGLGDGLKRALPIESDVRTVARKSLVFKSDKPVGHILVEGDFVAKRPDIGIPPDQIDRFLGLPLRRKGVRNELLTLNHLE